MEWATVTGPQAMSLELTLAKPSWVESDLVYNLMIYQVINKITALPQCGSLICLSRDSMITDKDDKP